MALTTTPVAALGTLGPGPSISHLGNCFIAPWNDEPLAISRGLNLRSTGPSHFLGSEQHAFKVSCSVTPCVAPEARPADDSHPPLLE